MIETIEVKNFRVDDIPVIWKVIEKMNIIGHVNGVFTPHGNWKGLSVGEVVAVWMCYVLTTHDHRLSYLEDWVKERLAIFRTLLNKEIRQKDFTDDKLGLILSYFSDDERWRIFEHNTDSHVINVYNLSCNVCRVDATVAQSFQKAVDKGLLQHGHSKQFRDCLAQLKIMIASIDPMGYPVASLIVSGNRADDDLYIPAIKQSLALHQTTGKLYIGDCKMGSKKIRTFIVSSENIYLMPLSKVIVPQEDLDAYIEPVLKGTQKLQEIHKDNKLIAEGYETTIPQSSYYEGVELEWSERYLIIRSFSYARIQQKTLDNKINKEQERILLLNKRGRGRYVYKTKDELDAKCTQIITDAKLTGILIYEIEWNQTEKTIRSYKNTPARIEVKVAYKVTVSISKEAYDKEVFSFGWRVFATNADVTSISIEDAVLSYRKEYIIENNFNTLKNKTLRLLPLYLQKDNHIKGLVSFLLLNLKFIRILEYSVHEALSKSGESLQGLYPGNPKKSTSRPGSNIILNALGNIDCTIIGEKIEEPVQVNNCEIIPLTEHKKERQLSDTIAAESNDENKAENSKTIALPVSAISQPDVEASNTNSTAPEKQTLAKKIRYVIKKVTITQLTALQIQILLLLGFSSDLYNNIAIDVENMPYDMLFGEHLPDIKTVNETSQKTKTADKQFKKTGDYQEGQNKYFDSS